MLLACIRKSERKRNIMRATMRNFSGKDPSTAVHPFVEKRLVNRRISWHEISTCLVAKPEGDDQRNKKEHREKEGHEEAWHDERSALDKHRPAKERGEMCGI